MKKLFSLLLAVAVLFSVSSCAKKTEAPEPESAVGVTVTEPAPAETTAEAAPSLSSAEEIVDLYLAAFSMWSTDDYINMAVAEHKYQFLDLEEVGQISAVISNKTGNSGLT